MPKGYISSGVDFGRMEPPTGAALSGLIDRSNELVTNIFSSNDEFNQADDISDKLSMLGIGFFANKLDFSTSSMNNKTGKDAIWSFNPDMSVYKNNEGYTKEGVFMSFLKSVSQQILVLYGGDTKLTKEAGADVALSVYMTINDPNRNKNIPLDKTLIENIANLQNEIKNRAKSSIYNPLLESFFFKQETGMTVASQAQWEEFQAKLQQAKDNG
nr:hypothetical protein [Campylobacter iguaniorum]